MPHKDQFSGLLKIAWQRCARDVYDVVRLWCGGAVAGGAVAVFFLLNFEEGIRVAGYPIPIYIDIYPTFGDLIIYAVSWAYVNTATMLTFAAILAILIEYTYSFLICAYHYDNDSWFIVNGLRNILRNIRKLNEKSNADAEERKFVELANLENKLFKLKKGV